MQLQPNRPRGVGHAAGPTNLAAMALSSTYVAVAGSGTGSSSSASSSTSTSGGGILLPREDPATKLATQLCGQSLSNDFALCPLDEHLIRVALPTVLLEIAAGSGDAGAVVGAYLSADAPAGG